MPSSSTPSTQCFAGTGMQRNATFIYQMFPVLLSAPSTSLLDSLGTRSFRKVDGSPGVGRFKSFSLLDQSSSSLAKARPWVIKVLFSGLSIGLPAFLSQRFREDI